MTTVLALETSCDETSASVVTEHDDGTLEVVSNVVFSQIDMHARYGGVVPEVASREHLKTLPLVVQQALSEAGCGPKEIDLVAATHGPGLVGALLVGVSAGKALAATWGVPFVGVDHVEGHLFATKLEHNVEPPYVILLVAGGHTQIVHVKDFGEYEVLGSTIDDAAGEAYDKVARYLGLGYPGGPIIDKLAQTGDPTAVRFPRAMPGDNFDFSFSGLKTAVVNFVRQNSEVSDVDLAASFQEAVADVLVTKTLSAAKSVAVKTICMGGGVAANSRLRSLMEQECSTLGMQCLLPSPAFCTDNAAMIAAAGIWRFNNFGASPDDLGAVPTLRLGAGSHA